jgi:hypothetical protein
MAEGDPGSTVAVSMRLALALDQGTDPGKEAKNNRYGICVSNAYAVFPWAAVNDT